MPRREDGPHYNECYGTLCTPCKSLTFILNTFFENTETLKGKKEPLGIFQ